MQYHDPKRMQEASKYIQRANEYAFTFAHPAYRQAEQALRNLCEADEAEVNQVTGGLKAVIGRGITV